MTLNKYIFTKKCKIKQNYHTTNQNFGIFIGKEKELVKMYNFKLSVSTKDVPKDLKGKEIGDKIKDLEKEKFLTEAQENLVRKDNIETHHLIQIYTQMKIQKVQSKD